MNKLFSIILLLSFLSCRSQSERTINSIVNTNWECKIAEGCINIYKFKSDNEFSFVSCEMEDVYYGKYYFVVDTLILEQLGSISDKELPEDSLHIAEKKLYKIDIKGNKLTHINMSNWVNGKWVKSDFKFDPNYIYKRKK